MLRRQGLGVCSLGNCDRNHLAARSSHGYGLRLGAMVLAVVLTASPAALADRPLGIDVSKWCPLTQAEWNAIRNSGRTFAFARASWGCSGCYYGGTDIEFVNHMTRGVAAGMIMGAYHFSYPGDTDDNTPINEATTFLNAASDYIIGGYLRPVLDVERAPGSYMGGLTLTQWVNQWMDYVQAQTGVEPLIYTGAYFAQAYLEPSICSRDLWIAAWPIPQPDPQTANPAYLWQWSTWCFWQYAGDVPIPGVTTQKVDLNVFNGTAAQLQNFVITSAPVITHHPSNQNVCPGGTATFTVQAMGSLPLSYQWKKGGANVTNGGHYSGCTTATLTVSSCSSSDEALYSCYVTNTYGNATSNTASLSLKTVTAITQQPSPQHISPGGTAIFTVAATGSGLTYQWQKNTVNITTSGGHYSGYTTATLTVSNAGPTEFGRYRCVVTGDCGSPLTSNAVLLTTGQVSDFNADSDVDQEDFGVFESCLTGPGGGPPDSGCGGADLDGDNDVDSGDLAKFKGCRSGPEISGTVTCAD